MQKKVIITGVAGQDGSYLAELLFSKGYEVHGVDKSFEHLPKNTKNSIANLYEVDLIKTKLLAKLILDISPHEIYHLAAYHFSTQQDGNRLMAFGPFNAINLLATNEILETIRNDLAKCKFFYASSSHIFGKVDHYPQNETTPYKPESLYSITKAAGTELCKFYRDYYNIYASTGILYNHESPRRPISFVTSQIAEAAAKASLGLPVKLNLRNLDAIVDWGAAKDYTNAMWLIMQQNCSNDYIIASGVPHYVYEFSRIAFNHVKLNYREYIFQEPLVNKNKELPYVGDPSKLKNECNWTPSISFYDLIVEMVETHIERLSNVDNE